MLGKRLSSFTDLIRKSARNTSSNTPDWKQWVAATRVENYYKKDTVLDWLDEYGVSTVNSSSSSSSSSNKIMSVPSTHHSRFMNYLMQKGNEFETKVFEHLSTVWKQQCRTIGMYGEDSRSYEKYQETINAMKEGIPIIIQGVVRDETTQTYGMCDLIVRSDFLHLLIDKPPITIEYEKTQSLTNWRAKDGSPVPYHYRVIDIKWHTLPLRSDGIHLTNVDLIPAYKGQLWIYNNALAKMQGYNPHTAYILGRRWKYTKLTQTYRGDDCFQRLGVIDYRDIDSDYNTTIHQAINWIRDLRQNGETWSVMPPSRMELYPNMSNQHDQPWHAEKVRIAKACNDVTMLWNCSVKHREALFAKQIYGWNDINCNASNMGIISPTRQKTINSIIDVNRGSCNFSPVIIKNNTSGWQIKTDMELFIDFEVVNDILDDFTQFPIAPKNEIVFMIGVGYVDRATRQWNYVNFVIDHLTLQDERVLFDKFDAFLGQWKRNYGNTPLYHWGHAEQTFFRNAQERHVKQWKHITGWFDLHTIFTHEPIAIKGAFGYGLKEIATAMYDLGMIQSKWNERSKCVDGTSAMLLGIKCEQEANTKRITIPNTTIIQDVANYNNIDCRVVYEIIKYLRDNHVMVSRHKN